MHATDRPEKGRYPYATGKPRRRDRATLALAVSYSLRRWNHPRIRQQYHGGPACRAGTVLTIMEQPEPEDFGGSTKQA